MKEFNLDKLERKTPYQVPRNFFEEMQENVLKQTIKKEKKSARIFKLNFSAVTSIAAALALVFGFTFLWKTNQADITSVQTDNIKNAPKEIKNTDNQSTTVISKENNISKEDQIQNDVKESIKEQENTVAIEQNTNTSEESYDQLLNSLSDEELKDLAQNADKDIYLELFN